MRISFFVLLFLAFTDLWSQSVEEFKKDFENALRSDFSEDELNNMFSKYSEILTPHTDQTRLMADVKGTETNQYPLAEFGRDSVCRANMSIILNSDNRYQRILAYLVIASSGDSTHEQVLLDRLRTEKSHGNRIWAGMALLYLGSNHVTPLFDFLIEDEELNDAHMLPLFVKLNQDSLREAAYVKIESDNVKSKILAAQVLAFTRNCPKTEKLLKKAVNEWDSGIKGYAVYPLKELEIGNLLGTIKPLLDDPKTRAVAIQALANSPTNEDRQYIINLISQKDTVSKELLNGLFSSRRLDNIKSWLQILREKPIPQKYTFFCIDQPLLATDDLLIDLHLTLEKVKSPAVIHELVRALNGRTDDKSLKIMLRLLRHGDSSVRYWTASTLKGCRSISLAQSLHDLIKDQSLRTVALTDLIIDNAIDSLQSTYEKIYREETSLDWRRSTIKYLSTFPLAGHTTIFRERLLDSNEDSFVKRNAALGLGRLKDTNSVNLIVDVSRKEGENSDYNVQAFLVALGMIKSEKAKTEILRYTNSEEKAVRELVTQILSEWEH